MLQNVICGTSSDEFHELDSCDFDVRPTLFAARQDLLITYLVTTNKSPLLNAHPHVISVVIKFRRASA